MHTARCAQSSFHLSLISGGAFLHHGLLQLTISCSSWLCLRCPRVTTAWCVASLHLQAYSSNRLYLDRLHVIYTGYSSCSGPPCDRQLARVNMKLAGRNLQCFSFHQLTPVKESAWSLCESLLSNKCSTYLQEFASCLCGFALDRSSWDALPGVGHGFEMEGDQDLYQTLVERVCDGESWLPKSCNLDVGDLDKGLTDSALVTRSISYRFPPPSADLRKPASTPS